MRKESAETINASRESTPSGAGRAAAARKNLKVICVTPTKNEAWIIDRFLAAARLWADHIIVADQGSTDGTDQEIARAPGAQLVRNESPVFDERHRQQLLLTHARRIDGHRILIGLDADEALSANVTTSRQWSAICDAKPGTILRFRWVNILPGFERAWIQPRFIPFGFVDDGSEHVGRKIHSPRVPQPPNAPVLDIDDIVVLHFQYVLWSRMRCKQRWYQAWEYTKNQEKGPLQIFREYNHMHGSWPASEIHPIRPEWLEGYDRAGVDFRGLKCEPMTWWNREIAQMLAEHGPRRFRKLAIWDEDWNAVARSLGLTSRDLSDPRSWFEKKAHRWLALTQDRRARPGTRILERLLRTAGW